MFCNNSYIFKLKNECQLQNNLLSKQLHYLMNNLNNFYKYLDYVLVCLLLSMNEVLYNVI